MSWKYNPKEVETIFGDGAPSGSVDRPTRYVNCVTGEEYINRGGGSIWVQGGGGGGGGIAADIASATTIDLSAAIGEFVDVTGTTTITGITLNEGQTQWVRFTGALTLTNGASLVLPGAANITTVAGDYAFFVGYASGVVRCAAYNKVTVTGSGSDVLATSPTLTTPRLNLPTINSATATLGYNLTVYGAGTAYSLTNTAAAIDLGTTDPTKILDAAGTYLLLGAVQLTYTGATVVAETATLKLRRTNNTAADLTGSTVVLDLPVATTLTHTYGIVPLPPIVYTTAAADDSISIFGNVSAALGAGTIDVTAAGTSLVAVRLY